MRRGMTRPMTRRIVPSRMRDARLAAGLSRVELARRTGSTQPSIWRIEEAGRSPSAGQRPSADLVGAWAQACGVAIEDLYEDEPSDPGSTSDAAE